MADYRKPIIHFEFTNEFGDHFIASSTLCDCDDIGDDIVNIGRQFNVFLKQVGYVMDNDYMLMESLTDAERDYLLDALWEFRRQRREKREERHERATVKL